MNKKIKSIVMGILWAVVITAFVWAITPSDPTNTPPLMFTVVCLLGIPVLMPGSMIARSFIDEPGMSVLIAFCFVANSLIGALIGFLIAHFRERIR